MCGRIRQEVERETLAEGGAEGGIGDLLSRHSWQTKVRRPGQAIVVVLEAPSWGGRLATELHWGVTIHGVEHLVHNARIESAGTKSTWRRAYQKGRCAVPVRGWYEHDAQSGRSWWVQPQTPVWLGALVTPYIDTARAPQEHRVAICTTEATGAMRALHHRMPMIVDDPKAWIEQAARQEGTPAPATLWEKDKGTWCGTKTTIGTGAG